jgi:hypothetical protein
MLTDSGEVTKFIISSQPIVEQEEDDTVQVQYSFLQQDFPSRDELLDKTIQQLREYCRRYQVRYGRRKQDTVENLLRRFETLSSHAGKVNKLLSKLHEKNFPEPAVFHEYYRVWFGLIDKHNKKWYSTASAHYTHSSKQKFLISIMRSGVINVWALCNSHFFKNYKVLRKEIAVELLQITPEQLRFYSILP